MANLGHKIWIWKVNQEVGVESAIAKGYIATGENHKDIGDFSQFKHRDELLDAIYAHYGSRQYVRAAQSYINMMYEASIGDIVAICKIVSKKHYLYGWGIISSDCEYLKNENSPISIQVDWHKPIMENPVVADRLSDNEVFTVTDDAQAAQVVSLLKIDECGIMEKKYLQDYVDLLKANHNIILNGAPGTGKTYLAKKIAEEMGAKVKMVQFHPSYDYTDFVEGLRPIKDKNGNIGFERKDGVLKEFCKDALNISGFTDSQIQKAIEMFRSEMDGKLIPSYKRPQNQFGVRIIGEDIRIIPMGKLADYNGESTSLSSIKLDEVVDFIKTNVAHHSYEPSVGNYIKMHY